MPPLVLDFDRSVGALPGERRLPLESWQEPIRFGCSRATFRRLDAALQTLLPETAGPTFFGSGDFHHVSTLLIRRASATQACRVVVFDNHPDNMRFPFGIHCGSWVSHVAAMQTVAHVDVVGITSADVSDSHLWENRWWPLLSGKVTYWCIGASIDWARRLGFGRAYRVFDSADALTAAFVAYAQATAQPTYLSIDKDVLHPDVVHTNWDQGVLLETHLAAGVRALAANLTGFDVNGEVSVHDYATPWKRWLSARDEQPVVTADQVRAWQVEQDALNRRLLDLLPRE